MIRAALVVIAVGGCAAYEDHVRIEPLGFDEPQHLDCDKLCGGPDIHSVNFCTVATKTARPYLVCEVEGPHKFEVGIEPPRGFDTTLEGDVGLENCPLSACVMPVRARMQYSSAESFKVTRCRVAQKRPPALAVTKFLVCSVRTKANAFAAAQ